MLTSHIVVQCQCGKRLSAISITNNEHHRLTEVEVFPHKCTERPPAPSIDHLVTKNKEELEKLHKKFLKWNDMEKHWMCTCPICRSLELGGDCQDGN
jgi:hypothetical protein